MIQHAIQTKYQKYKSKNFIQINLDDNAFDVFENSVLLDEFQDILSVKSNNVELDSKVNTCVNLTKLVKYYNASHTQQITTDIFINGGFLLDVFENRDYFVQDDIFQYNNEKYLFVHSQNVFNRINVISQSNTTQQQPSVAEQLQLNNLKQYVMINMGSVDNVGFFLNSNCLFYKNSQLVKTYTDRLSNCSIVYNNEWYICFQNNFQFDQIKADCWGQYKQYQYLNIKDSKILYYIDSTLTQNLVKHGCSLKIDDVTYNTSVVQQIYYGGSTTLSKCVIFPYGTNDNVVKTISLDCKYICDTYMIPFNCLNSIVGFEESKSGNILIYTNDAIQQNGDWAIQHIYYLCSDQYLNKDKSIQQLIENISNHEVETNITKIHDNVIQLNKNITNKIISKTTTEKILFDGVYYTEENTNNVIQGNNIIKYYQTLCENKTAQDALQLFLKNNKNYNKDNFVYNYKQNKWQKGK